MLSTPLVKDSDPMKTLSIPSGRGLSAAATMLAACTLALPFTAKADRDDQRRGPPAAAPSGRAQTPAAAPQRPAAPPRPAAAPQRPAAAAAVPRPSAPQRPSVTPGSAPSSRYVTPTRPTAPAATVDRSSGGDRSRDRGPGGGDFRPRVPGSSGVVTDRPRVPGSSGVVTDRPRVPGSSGVVVDRPRDTRLPDVVRRPGVPSGVVSDHNRYPGTYRPSDPRGPNVSGRSQQVGRGAVPGRSFTDPSRFSRIDRTLAFRSYPHNHYRMNYGRGFHGLGWYFGPPNVTYYYDYPGISYYPSREYIPQQYVNLTYRADDSLDYAVQQALYQRGYYNGAIDGDIGPMSRLAIANFQADNGLEPTGLIDETLVSYLQID